ncbi:MAG: ATP-binding cassette domain-containing protein [archaeon]
MNEVKEEVIRLRNVSKHYPMGDSVVKALSHLEFKVFKGEFVAIMGPSGSGKCVVGDTEVISGDGIPTKIKDLEKRKNKEVYSLDKKTGKIKKFKVMEFYKRKEKNLLKIKTSGGREITVSEDHPFFTLREEGFSEIFANNLMDGCFVAIPRRIKVRGNSQNLEVLDKFKDNKSIVISNSVELMKELKEKLNFSRKTITKKFKINPGTYDSWFRNNNIPLYRFNQITEDSGGNIDLFKDNIKFTVITSSKGVTFPYSTSKDLMEIYGFLAGDGWIDEDGMKFSNFDRELIDRYNLLINKIFSVESVNCIEGREDHSSKLLKWFFECVFEFPLMKKSHNLYLPDFVFKCPDSEIASFIRGLFDCDSYVSKDKKEIEITLASERIIKQLQFLFLRFGIVTRYSEKIKYASNTKEKKKRKYFSLSISGYENLFLYDKSIGYNSLKKMGRLKMHLNNLVESNPNVDVIPCGDLIRRVRRDSGVILSRKLHNYLWAYESKRINPTKKSLGKIIQLFRSNGINTKELQRLLKMDVYWDKIRSVESIKKESFVYDISVPSASNFLANNFIVHNSTAMNLVGSLDMPTYGTIYLDGGDISEFSESNLAQVRGKKIGFIFQSFNLIPNLTVKENVMLPMMFQGTSVEGRENKAEELLKLVELGDRMEHYPGEISGGQMQRVAIARSLANDPEVILADEPTGNLDTKTGAIVMDFLEKLNRQGKTVIMVTHDPDLAKKYADVIYWLLDGGLDKVTKRVGKNFVDVTKEKKKEVKSDGEK